MSSPIETRAQKNSIVASLHFNFRGQQFKPSISIDLDSVVAKQGHLDHLYDLLATSIGLDAYRHEYDVMVMEEITFSEASGLVSDFVHDGQLEFESFAEAWQRQRALAAIEPIARKHLNITDLNQHPDICNALIESYRSAQQKPVA